MSKVTEKEKSGDLPLFSLDYWSICIFGMHFYLAVEEPADAFICFGEEQLGGGGGAEEDLL